MSERHIHAFARSVQRLPSCIVISTRRLCMVVSHGAIGEHVHRHKSTTAEVLTSLPEGDIRTLRLDKSAVEELEWCDYDVNNRKRGRPKTTRKFADAFMTHIGAAMHIGGHQDFVESFGVLESSSVSEGPNWRRSPAYMQSTTVPLLVSRELCGDGTSCPALLTGNRVVRLSTSKKSPIIVKTSIAYTGKPTVTGAAFVSTARLPNDPADTQSVTTTRVSLTDCGIYAYVLPRRSERSEIQTTRRASWSHADIKAMRLTDWAREVEELPVYYAQRAVEAYKDDTLRRIDAMALSMVLHEFNKVQADEDNHMCIIRRDNATILFVGDIHSNIHGLLDVLTEVKRRGVMNDRMQLHASYILVFMGDYGHRGPYGMLVYCCLMQLKIQNPSNVFMIRGNHERTNMWHSPTYRPNGIVSELEGMTWRADELLDILEKTRSDLSNAANCLMSQ